MRARGAIRLRDRHADRGDPHDERSRRQRSLRPADSRPGVRRSRHVRREGPGDVVSADRAAAAAGRRAQRARRAARRRRLRGLERLRRADLDADGGAARRERAQVQPLPHHCALLADAPGTPHRAEPPRGRDGRDHRDRDVGARLQLDPPEHLRSARRDAQAERLLDCAVRQVPRGARLGDEPDGAVQRVADRIGLRALLRLHRRRDEPVRAGDLPRHGARRAGPDGGGGLPLHRGHDRPGDRLGQAAEGADAGQALLRLLRPRRNACSASRAAGMVGQVQGAVRRRLGRAARADVREAEGARRDPAGGGAHRASGGDPRLGRHAGRPEARARAPDGGLRRLPRAHRPLRGQADRRAERARDPREHARLLHHRRQRRFGRGHAERLLQRARRPERRLRARDDRVHGLADRRLRHAGRLQPLRRRLGTRDGHAVPVDEAGRLALGRDAERDDRALARRLRRSR